MPIQIRCTCQQILTVDEAHQGQVVGCPYCGTRLTVPVVQQQPQQPPPGYAPPPGYPQQQPQGYPPQNFSPPGYSAQGYPSQSPAPAGWQQPQAAPPGISGNPFTDGPSSGDASNPFASMSGPTAGGGGGNPFGAPQAPGYPAPGVPSYPSAPAPSFPAAAAPSFSTPTAAGPASNAPSMPFLAMDVPASGGPNINDLSRKSGGDWSESAPAEQKIWHIPCPNGHILETPEEMLDQEVRCPFCETQFVLDVSQSVEEKERLEHERAIRDEKAGQLWLKWAIGIAVVVILGVIVMIVVSASQ